MPKRDDPITDIPSIAPDQDEVARFQRTKGKGGKSTASTEPVAENTRQASSGGGGGIAWLALLAVVALGALGYWQAMQWEAQRLEAAERDAANLKQAEQRIALLEGRLSNTDDSLNESGVALKVQLKEVNSEIRKLWGVSNDRNKKRLNEHKKRLDGLAKQLTAAETAIQSATKTTSTMQTQLATLKKQAAEQKKALAGQVDSVKALRDSTAQLQKQWQSLSGKAQAGQQSAQQYADRLNLQEQKLASLEAELIARMATQDEAAESFDIYRKQVNQSLLKLKEELRRVQQAAP